jgi:hypothetical protein
LSPRLFSVALPAIMTLDAASRHTPMELFRIATKTVDIGAMPSAATFPRP